MRARALSFLAALALFVLLPGGQTLAGNAPVGGGGSCTGQIEPDDNTQGQQQAYDNGLYTCTGGVYAAEAFIVGSKLQDGTSASCSSTTAGMLQWTGAAFQYCDGSSWQGVGTSTTINLGTVASTTNPRRSGDATTGFYTPGANQVAVAAGGIEVELWNTVASGVNYLSITPAATGGGPILAAAGSDSNIDLKLTPKGTGNLNLTTGRILLAGNNGLWQDTATLNTAVGATSLPTTISQTGGGNNGRYNTALGYQALNANTTGAWNTAVGDLALVANTTGIHNTAVGSEALWANTTGSLNTAVGYDALYANTTGTDNTAVGLNALAANTTGQYSTAVGSGALQTSTTGGNNTAMGYQALYSATTATDDTAVGYNALKAATTGINNTAVGSHALEANTTGVENTAVGRNALTANVTSIDNTAVGHISLSSSTSGPNTAVGAGSLATNTTGVSNTAVGYTALFGNTTGAYNTAIGEQALTAVTTGVQNTALGYQAAKLLTTGTNNTVIGYNVASTTLTTGSSNILIGTSSAVTTAAAGTNYNLNIGNLLQGDMTNSTSTYNKTLYLQSTASGVDYIQISGAATASPAYPTILATGSDTNVGLAITMKGTGTLQVPAVNSQTTASAANVNVDGSGNLKKSTSSIRYKRDIRPYDRGLEAVMKLKPVYFKSKAPGDGDRQYAGLIAEDIDAAGLKEFVFYDDKGRPDALMYQHMVALLAKGMQEQQHEIEGLQAEIRRLRATAAATTPATRH